MDEDVERSEAGGDGRSVADGRARGGGDQAPGAEAEAEGENSCVGGVR